ncbi:MAG: efflux RND transporter permease subunit [Phycisphaerales bacterium]|nr:efflux RND transporter permease subunit [Phycisphaerales bacterium]
MLQRIVELSIRFRGVVLALALLLLAYGLYAVRDAKLDVFPDFVQPQATIQTEAPGLSPEQVETLVTRVVEGAVNGISQLDSVRSQSIEGLSIVSVFFRDGTDVFLARQLLTEQLSAISAELPVGVHTPKLTPLTSSTMDLLKIGLLSDKLTPMQLREFADWTLRPRLQAVQGIAQVGVMGGEVRELQIQVIPDRLQAFGLAMDDVLTAARRATGARGAGYVETANQRIVLQSEGQVTTPEQLGEMVVRRADDADIRLRDVAHVVVGAQPKFGDVLIQGRPGVLVKLLSQYGANTMEVTRAAEEAIEEMLPVMAAEGIDLVPRIHRPATFIETALQHVGRSLAIGAGLVVVVLMLFLFNLRAALISIVAIPLSLLSAVIVLGWYGLSLNTITLGGLAIAIGEVVDDAIIDVENIFRRLRENRAAGRNRSIVSVVLDASVEVRGAVVYATFIVALVFVPVLTLSGLQGRMFAPLGVAYLAAILASLLVALTVTPAMSAMLLPRAAQRVSGDSLFVRGLNRVYTAILKVLLPGPWLVLLAGVVATVLALALTWRFGEEFLPEFREGHFVVQVSAVPGASLPEMQRLGALIANDLQQHIRVDGKPVIEAIGYQAGRAELGEDPWGPHRAEFHIELTPDVPGQDQADAQEQIRERLEEIPGISTEVLTFLGDRISETISGETASVVVSIFGDDLDALDAAAIDVATAMGKIRGAVDVRVVSPPGMPQMLARLRPDRIAALGVRPLDALEDIETAYTGARVAQFYEGSRVFDIRVILDPALRRDPETLGDLPLRAADGSVVTLATLADLTPSTGRYMLLHEAGRRRQTVVCNVQGRDVHSFTDDVREQIEHVKLRSGMYTEISGAAEAGDQARNELLLHSGVAGIGILILLAIVFRCTRRVTLVLVNVPFALIGGVLVVWLTSNTLSIGSIVGFVTLFGITMRNSVMLISHFEHLETQEGHTWGSDLILLGASERLVPVLMTALVTGLGLLPIALGSGEVGREIEGPMALVILGGLFTSTVLNLLLVPVLYLRFGHSRSISPVPE